VPTIGTTIVPETLFADAMSICKRGGKCYLSMPEPPGSCTNCSGGGLLFLQVVVSGPHESPVSSRGEGDGKGGESVLIWERGQWYLVHTRAFPCPVCNKTARGGGRYRDNRG